MPEMHLTQPGFTYSACVPFTKNKERIEKFKETDTQAIATKMNLIRLVFNMAWLMEIASDKVLRDKAFNIAKNPKYDGYQKGLAFMVYNFLDKKSAGSGVNMHTNIERPLDLLRNYTNQLLENLKKRTVYSRFKGNIWSADLVDMQLINKFNKGFRF